MKQEEKDYQTIWVLEIQSVLGFNVKNSQHVYYANKPSMDDLAYDIFGSGEHSLQELSKVKELADKMLLKFNTRTYTLKEITLIQN